MDPHFVLLLTMALQCTCSLPSVMSIFSKHEQDRCEAQRQTRKEGSRTVDGELVVGLKCKERL
jgi:hypothetical protein